MVSATTIATANPKKIIENRNKDMDIEIEKFLKYFNLDFYNLDLICNKSDRCQSRLGPRRPFILVLSLMALLGLIFILNAYELSQLFEYIFPKFDSFIVSSF